MEARSSVFKDLLAGKICMGSPMKVIEVVLFVWVVLVNR